MPQVLSKNSVLLRGAGRTNIEYSAGPNINITDDVISGRDWTNDINQAVASGLSGRLSGGENIAITNNDGISTISISGDIYSAGENINITDKVISGKDWTNDIDEHIESAVSGKADASAIPTIVDYSAGSNINISDHVISGKDWSPELDVKLDKSAYISGTSSFVTVERMYDELSSISSHISADSPWISGNKILAPSAVQLEFGGQFQALSSFDLSGDHNHYLLMKGAAFRLPDIDPYLSAYLPVSSFNNYTDYAEARMSAIFVLANSAYTTAVNNYHSKLDKSAFDEYSAAHSGDDAVPYSAGDNINVTDHIISGRDWTDVIQSAMSSVNVSSKLDTSAFNLYSAAHSGDDITPYSAGSNINVTDHVISGKDWSNEIAAAGSGDKTPYSGSSGIQVQDHVISITGEVGRVYSAGANINISNQNVISGKDWTNTIDSHIASATSAFLTSGDLPSAKPVSGASGIKIEELTDRVVFSISGDVGKTYSAGANINITNEVISGRDWSTNISSATSGKLDSSWTAGKDVTPYSAGNNIKITNHVVSGKDWTTEISSATSGKLDTTAFTAYTATAGDYSGIAPITVDNVNRTISVSAGYTLSAGSGINFTDDFADKILTINADTSGFVRYTDQVLGIGNGNEISGTNSYGFGAYNIVSGVSLAAGLANRASARSLAVGQNSYAYDSSLAVGYANIADYNSIAVGDYNRVHNGQALGLNLRMDGGMAIGKNNLTSADALFVIGNGSGSDDSARSDAFVIDKSGNVFANGEQLRQNYYFMNIADTTGIIDAYENYPPLDHDWVLDIKNLGGAQVVWSAFGGTATLDIDQGVRIHYSYNDDTLLAEPVYPLAFDEYATKSDLGGMTLEMVGSSAQATGTNILYIITGSN